MNLKQEVLTLLKIFQDYMDNYNPNLHSYWQQMQNQTEHIKITHRLMYLINYLEDKNTPLPMDELLISNNSSISHEPPLQFLLDKSLSLYLMVLKKSIKKSSCNFIGSTYSSN